jgi:hypothetical protein
MKISHFFLLLWFLPHLALSQDPPIEFAYEPMVVENAHWIVKEEGFGPYSYWVDYYDYFLRGDTLADTVLVVDNYNQVLDTLTQVSYKNLHRRLVVPTGDLPPAPAYTSYALSNPPGRFYSLREDTINRKVYLARGWPGDGDYFKERLFYDFSLETGDTLPLRETYLNFSDPYVVDTVRREVYCGKERTTLYLSQIGIGQGGATDPILWEGVGNEGGVIWRFGSLHAYDQVSTASTLLDFCIGDDSTCGIAVLQMVNSLFDPSQIDWQVFPNPARDHLNLRFPDWRGGISYELVWTDALGRACTSTRITASEQVLSMADLTPGWYVLELREAGRLIGRRKVVVE